MADGDLKPADPSMSDGSASSLPEQFGRYQILSKLGGGGMGAVYLAHDSKLGRRVALKVPYFGPNDGSEARQRFLEEARTAATLDHPYLCPVYDVGEIDGRLYLTMAYIEGRSLAETIRAEGMPARQVAALVGKLALAMQEAHVKKVIHRDLKPANVMIKATGQRREPVIVDFGLARKDGSEDARLTKTGQVVGTLGYMAPEQIRGELKDIGPACDIYSMGVILYELLTGRMPFRGSGLAVAGQILTQEPLPLSAHRTDIDPRLETICRKAMAKKVADRYGSMKELAQALTEFLQTASDTETPRVLRASTDPSGEGDTSRLTKSTGLVDQLLKDPSAVMQADPSPVSEAAGEVPLETVRRPSLLSKLAVMATGGLLVLGTVAYLLSDKSQRPSKAESAIESENTPTTAKDDATAPDPDEIVNRELPASTKRPPFPTTPARSIAPASKGVSKRPATPGGMARPINPEPVAIFNGRDITDWRSIAFRGEQSLVDLERVWSVRDGVLFGTGISGPIGPGPGATAKRGSPTGATGPNAGGIVRLFSPIGDYRNFRLKAELQINDGGRAGLAFRVGKTPSPGAYEVAINSNGSDFGKTGSLSRGTSLVMAVNANLVKPETWFTLEIEVIENRIMVSVDSKKCIDWVEERRMSPSGHVSLNLYGAKSLIKLRKLEIQEIESTTSEPATDSFQKGRVSTKTKTR